jgi:hypothetical protein
VLSSLCTDRALPLDVVIGPGMAPMAQGGPGVDTWMGLAGKVNAAR